MCEKTQGPAPFASLQKPGSRGLRGDTYMCTSVSSVRAVSLYTIGNHHSPEGTTPARQRRHPFSMVNPEVVSCLKDLGPRDHWEAPQPAIQQGL